MIAIGLIANVFIKNYQANLTEQQFFLEKKLAAIINLSEAYDKMFVASLNFTDPNPNKALSDVNSEQYEKTIDNFNNAYGRWSILLSHKFFEESKCQMWIYLGINHEDDDKRKIIEHLWQTF